MIGRNFTNANVLVQFLHNFRQIMQSAQHFAARLAPIIEIAGNQPVHVAFRSFRKGPAPSPVYHIWQVSTHHASKTSEHRATVRSRNSRNCFCFPAANAVLPSMTVMGRVNRSRAVQLRDQPVKLLQVPIITRLLVGVDDDWMNFSRRRLPPGPADWGFCGVHILDSIQANRQRAIKSTCLPV